MRANWIHETMPWIAPVRGLLAEPTDWHNQVFSDMQELGMNLEDEYVLPSPPAVRAGRGPARALNDAGALELVASLEREVTGSQATIPEEHGSESDDDAPPQRARRENVRGIDGFYYP